MALLKCCYKNILETSTVTLGTGNAENALFPLYRIYDRDIGRLFKPDAVETIVIKIDQASALPVDRLLIPPGHNLAGMTLDIEHSEDDTTYTPAIAQWTGEVGLIDKSWSTLTKRYWRFTITSPGSVPEIPELFLTSTYTWERNPDEVTGAVDDVFNVEMRETAGGNDRFLVHGLKKRHRAYAVSFADSTQKASIEALNAEWAGSKPFWLYDHNGVCIYGKLLAPLNLTSVNDMYWNFVFDFLEVLA